MRWGYERGHCAYDAYGLVYFHLFFFLFFALTMVLFFSFFSFFPLPLCVVWCGVVVLRMWVDGWMVCLLALTVFVLSWLVWFMSYCSCVDGWLSSNYSSRSLARGLNSLHAAES